MKNLIIYINPSKQFDKESRQLIKIQIDNSLDLGWERKDILLVTNFDYEYNGVKALLVGDDNYCKYYRMGSKEKAILTLFDMGLIGDDLYWLHDLDCYQCVPLTEEELELGNADVALTDYGSMTRWSTGSVFFKKSARDIFKILVEVMDRLSLGEEQSLQLLTENHSEAFRTRFKVSYDPMTMPWIDDLTRIKKINNSYNFIWFNIRSVYKKAIKPLRCIHFHPEGKWTRPDIPRMLDFFMYGKNKLNIVFMPKRLIKIFHYHYIR